MAEVVDEINRAFESDPNIDELGMVLSTDESVVLVEHKLGISMGILKDLFKYSIEELQKNHSVLHRPAALISHSEAKHICNISRAILLVKGDFPPALNARKTMIVNGYLSAEGEIQFLNVIFSKHPKSPSAWHHRRWCLLRILSSRTKEVIPGEKIDCDCIHLFSFSSVMAQEINLCERMCDLYPRNYYSWNHRLWLAKHMDDLQQLEEEFGKISLWLQRHISDHSAINHQHQVVLLLISRANATLSDPGSYTVSLLAKCMCESTGVLHSSGSGGHASLWSLRRLWVQTILSVLGRQCNQTSRAVELATRGDPFRHSFDVCFQESDPFKATASESETILYLQTIQSNALNCIIENYSEVNGDCGSEEDSFIGLSTSSAGMEVTFSAIEVELDLSRLLTDGVTYPISNQRHGGDNANVDDICDNKRDSCILDEVTASCRMHTSRLCSLLNKLTFLQNPPSPNLTSLLSTDTVNSTISVMMWLSQFVAEELLFCGSCISSSGWYTSNCWEPQDQRSCALEYASFVVYQVLHFTQTNGLDVVCGLSSSTELMTDNLKSLATLTCRRYYSEGAGKCAGKMQAVLNYSERPAKRRWL